MNLTKSEIEQILTLVYDNIEDGSCYGRKDYWQKRNQSIIEKLEKELKDGI